MKPRAETDHRRSGQRILGAAEGVPVALCHFSLDDAFFDIVQTAKRHGVAPLELADALVAVAENDVTRGFDDAVIAAVDRAWGTLLCRGPNYDSGHEQAQQPPMPVCTSGGPPKLMGFQP